MAKKAKHPKQASGPRVARRRRLERGAPFAPPVDRTLEELLAGRSLELGFERVPVADPYVPKREPSRWDVCDSLPGTGMFSAYPELNQQITIIRLLKSQRWLYEPLREAVAALGTRPGKSGPERMEGCWALATFAFVESRMADVQPWYNAATPEMWRECHFLHPPAYKTAQRRIKETESIAHVFAEALHQLVQPCRKREPRIGHAISVDATMSESNARLHKIKNPDGKAPKKVGNLPVIATRMPTETVDEIRRASNELAPDVTTTQVGEWTDVTSLVESEAKPRGRLFTLKTGTYYALDPDAGLRAYARQGKLQKWWFGYLLHQPDDLFTGLPLEAHGHGAHEAEHQHYAPVVEKAIATLGRTPHFVSTDKGSSYDGCFRWSALRGITLVAPYRPPNSKWPAKAQASVHFDEHGIPYCRSCGGGTDQVGFPAGAARHSRRPAAARHPCALRRTPVSGVRRRAGMELSDRSPAPVARVAHEPRLHERANPPHGAGAGAQPCASACEREAAALRDAVQAHQPHLRHHAPQHLRHHRVAARRRHQRLAGHARAQPAAL